MKIRILASVVGVVGSICIGLSPETVAAKSGQVTYITGHVQAPQQDPFSVAGFEVSASCRDPFTHESFGSGSDITDVDGGFLIILPREHCPEDSRVWAGAERDGELHFGRASDFLTNAVNSKLVIRQSPISLLW